MVQALSIDQVSLAAEMGPVFFAEGKLPGRFVPSVFISKWTYLIESGLGFILGLFRDNQLVGVFGAIVAEDLNDGDMVANECFWFVKPEARGRGVELLSAYEAEAKKRGAVRCSMIHLISLQPDRLAHIYQKRGYRAIETSYFKDLK